MHSLKKGIQKDYFLDFEPNLKFSLTEDFESVFELFLGRIFDELLFLFHLPRQHIVPLLQISDLVFYPSQVIDS